MDPSKRTKEALLGKSGLRCSFVGYGEATRRGWGRGPDPEVLRVDVLSVLSFPIIRILSRVARGLVFLLGFSLLYHDFFCRRETPIDNFQRVQKLSAMPLRLEKMTPILPPAMAT